MASCKRALGIAKQGGTAGISILWPVLDVFEDGSFYCNSRGEKMLNLTLEQVKAYAKEYKAVPVAKECLADMLTPLAFLVATISS